MIPCVLSLRRALTLPCWVAGITSPLKFSAHPPHFPDLRGNQASYGLDTAPGSGQGVIHPCSVSP